MRRRWDYDQPPAVGTRLLTLWLKAVRRSRRYRERRRRFLGRNPLCAWVDGYGSCQSFAVVLDHYRPAALHPEEFWRESNWQGLCRRHNDRKTHGDQALWLRERGGVPVRPAAVGGRRVRVPHRIDESGNIVEAVV